VKKDLLLSAPLSHYPAILNKYVISVQTAKNLVFDINNFDHLQNTCNANFSFECEEKKASSLIPPISHLTFPRTKGEIFHFSYSPLCNSSDHDDAFICDIELYNRCYCDLFID